MRLGLAVLAPGARSRIAALRAAALSSLPIIAGAALMLVLAAAIEAFWSPRSASRVNCFASNSGLTRTLEKKYWPSRSPFLSRRIDSAIWTAEEAGA